MGRGSDSLLFRVFGGSVDDLLALFGWMAALFVLLVILIWSVVRIRARYRGDDDPAAIDRAMLLRLGESRRRGDLSESEYRSIKGQLIERMDETPAAGPRQER